MAAYHSPRSRHIAIVALVVFAHCVQLSCASLLAPSKPHALGGIRVRMHALAASRQGPTIVYLEGQSPVPVSEVPAQVVAIVL